MVETGSPDRGFPALPLARADLHLHTNASIFKYFRAGNTRDSYNDPDETYRLAKARGMDFVTFTDHDTVDGCLKFRDRHPDYADFFVSAEIETFFPKTGHRIHVNVFDLTLAQWKVINVKRRNIFDLVEYLRAESLLYSANHLFQSYRMRQAPEDFFTKMLELFDVFEVKNGSMAYQHNALVEDLLTAAKEKRGSLALIGGSDAHTYPPVASVFTMAPGATLEGVPRVHPRGRVPLVGDGNGLHERPRRRLQAAREVLHERHRLPEPGVHDAGRRRGTS